MYVNNIKNKNENIVVVLPNYIPDADIQVFYYITATSKDILAFTTTVKSGFKYVYMTTPNVDCVIFLKYGTHADFIVVGSPPRYYLLHYITTNTSIDYTQYDLNSNVIANGTLDALGDDFYVTGIQSIEPSFFSVLGNISTVTTKVCGSGSLSGEIILDNNQWQLIAIPVKGATVKEYLLDQIDDIVKSYDDTKSTADIVERVSAYPGGINKFLTYIPNITPVDTDNNFQLVYSTSTIDEITAFWIKMKDYKNITNGDDIIINWSSI